MRLEPRYLRFGFLGFSAHKYEIHNWGRGGELLSVRLFCQSVHWEPVPRLARDRPLIIDKSKSKRLQLAVLLHYPSPTPLFQTCSAVRFYGSEPPNQCTLYENRIPGVLYRRIWAHRICSRCASIFKGLIKKKKNFRSTRYLSYKILPCVAEKHLGLRRTLIHKI